MITCPSCNHQNPEGSFQCETCSTPMPATTSCPNCGASVQTDATFCGQCGFNLQAESSTPPVLEETAIDSFPNIDLENLAELSVPDSTAFSETEVDILPETAVSFPIKSPWDMEEAEQNTDDNAESIEQLSDPESIETIDPPSTASETEFANLSDFTIPEPVVVPESAAVSQTELESLELSEPEVEAASESSKPNTDLTDPTPQVDTEQYTPKPDLVAAGNLVGATQLQTPTSRLLHVQSNTIIEIPSNLDVVHIGKPNGQIPPDIDVAGFPDSEVVSRVHADIRVEGDVYYIEDVGSSNGTYINHAPLVQGNRHRLRAGDRVALGKGDLVTFIFQIN